MLSLVITNMWDIISTLIFELSGLFNYLIPVILIMNLTSSLLFGNN